MSMKLRDYRAKFIAEICINQLQVSTPDMLNYLLLDNTDADVGTLLNDLGVRVEYEWEYLAWFLKQSNLNLGNV